MQSCCVKDTKQRQQKPVMFHIITVLLKLVSLLNPSNLLVSGSADDSDLPLVSTSIYDLDYIEYMERNANFITRSKHYLEIALRLCPSIEFCLTKRSDHVVSERTDHGSDNMSQNFSSLLNTTPFYTTYLYSSTTNLYKTTSSPPPWTLPEKNLYSRASGGASPSCCTQCSCSPDCFMSYNCCPDAQPNLSLFTSSASYCLSAYTDFSQHRFNTSYVDKSTWPVLDYMIATHCKYQMNNCSHDPLDLMNITFDDVVLVSSENKIYRNKHCALCDDETNIKRWNLMATDCVDDLYTLSLTGSALIDYVLTNCIVYSVPPSDVDVELSKCHHPEETIFYCNDTGLWDFYDPLLGELCSSDTYFAYDETGGTYENIFCLMCNKPSGYIMPQMCTAKKEYTVPIKGPAYILFLDQDLDNTTTYGAVVGSGDCSESMVLDPYLNKCRELFCPFQGFASNGLCYTQRQFVAINRIFDIGYKLHLSEIVSMEEIRNGTFEPSLSDIFDTYDVEGVCEVMNVTMTVIVEKEGAGFSNIILRLQLKTSQLCDEEFIRRLHTRDYVTPIDVPINPRRRVQASIEPFDKLDNPFPSEKFQQETQIYRKEGECTDCYIADIGSLSCPYFKLDQSEYCSLYGKISARTSVDLCPQIPFDDKIALYGNDGNETTEHMYYVCAHDYEHLTVQQPRETNPSCASKVLTSFWVVILNVLFA